MQSDDYIHEVLDRIDKGKHKIYTKEEWRMRQALLDIIEICEHTASTKLDSVYKIAKEATDADYD